MPTGSTEQWVASAADWRSRLEEVRFLLEAVASSEGVGDKARASLGTAIHCIRALGDDVAAACPERARDHEESLRRSREQEARSEVDSGEFDMHG